MMRRRRHSCLARRLNPSVVVPLSGDYSGMISVEALALQVLSRECQVSKKMKTISSSSGRKKPVRKVRGGRSPPLLSFKFLERWWRSRKVVAHSKTQKERGGGSRTSTQHQPQTLKIGGIRTRMISTWESSKSKTSFLLIILPIYKLRTWITWEKRRK